MAVSMPGLAALEDLMAETQFNLRYAKGNFKSGFCIINDQKIVLVNAFADKQSRVYILAAILRNLNLDPDQLSDRAKKTLWKIAPPTA